MKFLATASFPVARQKWLDDLRKRDITVETGLYPRREQKAEVAFASFKPQRYRDVVVLFHGTGNDLFFTWQRLIERLLSEGHAVFTFDLDGHGRLSSTLFDSLAFPTAAEDLKAALEHFFPGIPQLFIAYSLGALLALHSVKRGVLQPEGLAMLAVPEHITLTTRFFLQEGLALFHPEFWRQARHYGWREAVPAFGSFRRESFPIRLPAVETRSYPRIVQDLFTEAKAGSILEALHVPQIRLYAAWDRLAIPQDPAAPGQRIIDRGNHFLLPFQAKTLDSLSEWMKS